MELEQLGGLRLGKQEYEHDERTLRMASFMVTTITVPKVFDFDKSRKAFPQSPFGNTSWGNCVKVGQVNALLRTERLEQRRTLPITPEMVVQAYMEECERQFGPPRPQTPGDERDNGLFVIKNLGNWRNIGWTLDFTKKPNDSKTYKIAAYGELDPGNAQQLRQGIYLMHGIQMGFWLPRAAQSMTNQGYWEFNNEGGSQWSPGGWGGHLVYAYRYDADSVWVKSWGRDIRVNNAFVEKYCDEAWAVVDDFNSDTAKRRLKVDAMKKQLREIGASNIA